jgi:hypothetical protein
MWSGYLLGLARPTATSKLTTVVAYGCAPASLPERLWKIIEHECEVGHYTARRIAADVLEAVAKTDDALSEVKEPSSQRL